MRVVHVVTDLQPGGTPLRVCRLAVAQAAAGVDVVVGALAPRGPLHDWLNQQRIPNFACNATRPWRLDALLRLAVHLKHRRPNLVHAHLFHANIACRLVCRWQGFPLLTSTVTVEQKKRWHNILERWTRTWDAGLVVNNPAMAEHARSVFRRENVFTTPPTVRPLQSVDRDEARATLRLPPSQPIVAWMGRLDPVKRVEWLLDLARDEPGSPLIVLAGDGPGRLPLESEIDRRSINERVRLLGWLEQPELLLSAADLFALPSQTEGVPNALLEALRLGVPAVTTALPTLQTLAGTPAAFALTAIDDRESFVAEVRSLLQDASRRAEYSRRGRQLTSGWTDESVVSALQPLYQRVCDAFPRKTDADAAPPENDRSSSQS